jgi:ornithine carbamoyltransferase
MTSTLKGRNLLSIEDLTREEIFEILDTAVIFKKIILEKAGDYQRVLKEMAVPCVYEKPSSRTRGSFAQAIALLGGNAYEPLNPGERLGEREPIQDSANVWSRYHPCIIARVFAHKTLEELALHAKVPVINALSDDEHPCQVLADLLTIYEKKDSLDGLKIAWIGDGTNVCNSWISLAGKLGMDYVIAVPEAEEYQPNLDLVKKYDTVRLIHDPAEAVRDADVVITDTFVSMGKVSAEQRKRDLAPYQLNLPLLKLARPDVLALNCMPMYRGQEITEEVLHQHIDGITVYDGILDEAENRLYTAIAVLYLLLDGKPLE